MKIEKELKRTRIKTWLLLGVLIALTFCTTWYLAWLGNLIFRGLTS